MPLSGDAEFIILVIADTFLSGDYEYCLKIAGNDFSHVGDHISFRGNLMRFRSLASFRLFENAIQANDDDFEVNFDILIQSVRAAEDAHDLYR